MAVCLNKLSKEKYDQLNNETEFKKAFISCITHVVDCECFTL